MRVVVIQNYYQRTVEGTVILELRLRSQLSPCLTFSRGIGIVSGIKLAFVRGPRTYFF